MSGCTCTCDPCIDCIHVQDMRYIYQVLVQEWTSSTVAMQDTGQDMLRYQVPYLDTGQDKDIEKQIMEQHILFPFFQVRCSAIFQGSSTTNPQYGRTAGVSHRSNSSHRVHAFASVPLAYILLYTSTGILRTWYMVLPGGIIFTWFSTSTSTRFRYV